MKKLKKILLISFLIAYAGCTTNVTVLTVKTWEGHYFNTNDFMQCTKSILLEKNESIWVLSNDTLKRTLKNIERKQK